MENDIAFLKNDLSQLHREQDKDRNSLEALKELVSDNSWGFADLKANTNQMKLDLNSLKVIQQEQNATLWGVEDALISSFQGQARYHEDVHRLQEEMSQMRDALQENRNLMEQVRESAAMARTLAHMGPNAMEAISSTTESNNPAVAKLSQPVDQWLSSLGEKHNLVQDNIELLKQQETRTQRKIDQLTKQFVTYEVELGRLSTMYHNLSLLMAALENRQLQEQQQRIESEMLDFHQTFSNFTNVMMRLEQLHLTSHVYFNTSSQNQQEIALLAPVLEAHNQRLLGLENLVEQYRAAYEGTREHTQYHLHRLNNTLHTFYKSFNSHHTSATTELTDVDAKLGSLEDDAKRLDDRLLRVEVVMLNSSLAHCQKGSQDLEQDIALAEINKKLGQNDRAIVRQDEIIDK